MSTVEAKKFQLADRSKFSGDEVVRPNISYWQDAWRRLKKNKLAMLALFVLIISFFIFLPPIILIIALYKYKFQNFSYDNFIIHSILYNKPITFFIFLKLLLQFC